jgi:hypothetical protein
MARAQFSLTFTSLITVGLFGMWLEFQARDSSGTGAVLGLLLMLGAIVGLLITFRRDLRESESEKRVGWERTKAKGGLSHVLGQVALGVLSWYLLLLLSLLADVYWNRESWGAALRHLRGQSTLGVLVAAICGLWAVGWWSYQKRKC